MAIHPESGPMRLKKNLDQLMEVILLLGQKVLDLAQIRCKVMIYLAQRCCASTDRICNLSYRVYTTKSRDFIIIDALTTHIVSEAPTRQYRS